MVMVTFMFRLAVVAVLAAGLCGGLAGAAVAQQPDSWLTRLFQPPPGGAVPGGNDATQWSGQSGASGNPLMTADAIRAAAADFGNCIAGLWPDAERRGVMRDNFERFTAGLTPDLSIMDKLDAQPEFTKAPWDYLDLLVSDDRIARGRELLAQYAPTFAAVERVYGVDRHIVAAIWGVESNYGTLGGDRSVLRSTATLACVGRRRDYFREEFLSTLEPAAGRHQARQARWVMGWRVRTDAVHADDVQALRGRFRRRWTARRRRFDTGHDRLDREQP
jgi:membrane-bound lytic murein transglycosylase B